MIITGGKPVRVERALVELKNDRPDLTDVPPVWRGLFARLTTRWSDVLPEGGDDPTKVRPPIVLLAPSGSGKTTELFLLAERLQKNGRQVLAFEARRAAEEGVEAALSEQERQILLAWRGGELPITVLLDAVDEIYLVRRDLSVLESRLEEAGLMSRRVQFVLSARDDAWGRAEEGWMKSFSSRLAPPERKPNESEVPVATSAIEPGQLDTNVEESDEGYAEPPTPRKLGLCSLDLDQIGAFAVHFGLEDAACDDFTTAVRDFEIPQLFVIHPRDVDTLQGYWRAHRKFDAWRDVLHWHLRNGYQELNRIRPHHRSLSLERFLDGMRRIAAITTLSALRHVLRPGSQPTPIAPHAEELFPDWRPQEITELFESPLLVRKGGSPGTDSGVAVQVVEGQLRDYLAATWLARVFRASGLEDAVTNSIVVAPRGHSGTFVPSDRRAVAGWCAGLVLELRELIRRASPEVLLFHGDPADIPAEETRKMVQALVESDGPTLFEFASSARLRKAARPELEALVVRGLGKAVPDTTLIELLSLAEAGAYSTAVARALDIAMDQQRDPHVRGRAIDLIAKLDARKAQELQALLHDKKPPVRCAIYRALHPGVLRGPALVDFLADESDGSLVHEFKHRPLQLSKGERLKLATRLNSRFKQLVSQRRGRRTARTGTARLALALLESEARQENAPLRKEFRDLIEFLEHERSVALLLPDDEAELIPLLTRKRIWESIWKTRLRTVPDHGKHTNLCPMVEERFHWILERFSKAASDDERSRVRLHAHRFLGSLSSDAYARVRERASQSDHLQLFEDLEREEAQIAEARAEHTRKDQAKHQATRTKNSTALRGRIREIARGSDQNALNWAYSFLHTGMRRSSELANLAKRVEPDILAALREGFKAWWPRSEPRWPSDGGRTNGELWGLVGAMLEVEEHGATAFDPPRLRTATLLALAEINAVPEWFHKVYAADEEFVSSVLHEAIERQWAKDAEHMTFLARLAHFESPGLLHRLATSVFEQLQNGPPATHVCLNDGIDLMLQGTGPPDWVPRHCASMIAKENRQEWRAQWLRLWCHCAPVEAAKWVTFARVKNNEWGVVILKVCEELHWDLGYRRTSWTRFCTVEGLEHWIPLLFGVAPHRKKNKDEDGEIVATVMGPADRAEELRDTCCSRLSSNGSVGATLALMRLCEHPNRQVQDWAVQARRYQRDYAACAMQERWDVTKLLEAERYSRRQPLNVSELHRVAIADLRRLAARLADDDFSNVDLLIRKDRENLTEAAIQKWVASELRLAGSDVYSVIRENEVKDKKKIDISIFRPSIGRVPIEIKPVSKNHSYSLEALKKTIAEQLVEHYMRPADVTHGVLLLVRLDNKRWQQKGKSLNFAELQGLLQAYADGFLESRGLIIRVVGIDVYGAGRETRNASRRAQLSRRAPRPRKP